MNAIAQADRKSPSLESEVARLLTDLLAGQNALLEILSRKQRLLGKMDVAGMSAVDPEEQQLVASLQDCIRRREELLARAATEGLPSSSIRNLAKSLPQPQRAPLARQLTEAGARNRLLRTQSLTNWIIIQRTLLHLSQLLEIIATGGRFQPTYGEGGRSRVHGALVDQEA